MSEARADRPIIDVGGGKEGEKVEFDALEG